MPAIALLRTVPAVEELTDPFARNSLLDKRVRRLREQAEADGAPEGASA